LETTVIRDIYFLDKWNGLVATSDEGVLLTQDGGMTWKTILSTTGDIWKASFNGSTQIIHALGVDRGICYSSLDGGMSWKESVLGPFVSCLAIAPDHRVYVFAQEIYKASTRGWVTYSTDYGSTWIKSTGLADGDSYTLAADSCRPNTLYLLNEDWASTNNFVSEIFVTSDAGDSWQSYNKQSYPYLTGPFATAKHAMYAGTTTDDGTIRSTDKGVTWKKIGGPATEGDSRAIATVDDNIVFVLDTKGSIWATFNSGGHSVLNVSPNPPLEFSSSRIINDSTNILLHLPIYFHRTSSDWGADMIMHYRPFSLKLENTTLYNGKSFDVQASSTPGRALLHFTPSDLQAAPDSLLGYINFLWTPFELDCNEVIFDSITTFDPCTTNQSKIFSGIIGTNENCLPSSGVDAPPRRTESEFTMAPNPSDELLSIRAKEFSGEVVIHIFDLNGRQRMQFSASISPESPCRIQSDNLGAGFYTLRISYPRGSQEIPFIKR
ncbi:MAG: hypothetical protein ABI778_08665, partial [Ignavibacteriota bacterium]